MRGKRDHTSKHVEKKPRVDMRQNKTKVQKENVLVRARDSLSISIEIYREIYLKSLSRSFHFSFLHIHTHPPQIYTIHLYLTFLFYCNLCSVPTVVNKCVN